MYQMKQLKGNIYLRITFAPILWYKIIYLIVVGSSSILRVIYIINSSLILKISQQIANSLSFSFCSFVLFEYGKETYFNLS